MIKNSREVSMVMKCGRRTMMSFLLLLTLGAVAQERTTPQDSSYVKQLIIEKEFVPIVNDATKINRLPAIESITTQRKEVSYQALKVVANVLQLQTEVLKSEETRMVLPAPPKRGFASLTAGNYWNVNGSAGWNILQKKGEILTLDYNLNATSGKRKLQQTGVEKNVNDNNNRLSLSYLKEFAKMNLSAGVTYQNNYFGFFSVDSLADTTPNYMQMQSYNRVGVHVGLDGRASDKLMWNARVGYSAFHKLHSFVSNGGGLLENRIKANGGVAFIVGRNFNLAIDTELDGFVYGGNDLINDLSGENSFYNRLLWGFNPQLLWRVNRFDIALGFFTEVDFSSHSKFFIAPDLRVDWNVASGYQLFVSLDGRSQRMGFEEMYDCTRMLSPSLRVGDYATPLDFKIGLNASFMPNLTMSVSGGASYTHNQPVFVNKVLNEYAYSEMLVDQRVNVTYANFSLGAQYQINSKLDASIHWTQLFWNKEKPVYAIPATSLEVGLKYAVNSRVYTELAYSLLGGRKALNPLLRTEERMKNANLLSLRGGYALNSNFSVTLSLNNILNQKYDLLWGLPAQRFNVMIGANYNF